MVTKNNIALLILLCAVFLAVVSAEVSYTDSDPRGTLLVSQAILDRGTIRLDHYGPDVRRRYGWHIYKKINNHYYYFFPLGTSLAALPVVAVMNACGFDMTEAEAETQSLTAALVAVLTVLLLCKIARLYLPRDESLAAAALCWFGSSFASSTGTALWSHNFAALFALAAIFLTLQSRREGDCGRWPALAASLFAAYLCRPTMLLLAPCMLVILFASDRRAAAKAALLLSCFFALFITWSMYEFGQVLPDYYIPERLQGGHFLQALYGTLFSPARGLFVFSPFLLLPFFCLRKMSAARNGDSLLLLVALVWPAAHLAAVARFPHWWGGHCFGARFMTDALPGLFIFLCWSLSLLQSRARVFAWIFLAVAGTCSIYINSYQGLFNPFTAQWNAEPDIDKNSDYVFDWRFPQFLHTPQRHEERLMEFYGKSVAPLAPGELVKHTSRRVVFLGWSPPEKLYRWSSGRESKIFFKVSGRDRFKGVLTFRVAVLGMQRVRISLNGTDIYESRLNQGDVVVKKDFPAALLREGGNMLEFSLPNARQPGNRDPRLLAIALKTLSVL